MGSTGSAPLSVPKVLISKEEGFQMAFAPTPPPIDHPIEVGTTNFRDNLAGYLDKVRAGEVLEIDKRRGGTPAYMVSLKYFSAFALLRKVVSRAFDSALFRLERLEDDALEIGKHVAILSRDILTELREHMSIAPDRIVPLKDGEIDIYFFSPSKDAAGSPERIVCINVSEAGDQAEAAVLFSTGVRGESASEMITGKTSAQELSTQIEEFLVE